MNSADALHLPCLTDGSFARAAFFTRKGGVSEGAYASLNCALSAGDDPARVAENRARAAAFLGAAPEALALVSQIHSAEIVTIASREQSAAQPRPQADALVTRQRGVMLGILTADCVPVLFLEPQAGVIGAAHAGWRGALGGVLQNIIGAMEALGADRRRIQAAIGPCIWQDSYEVGPDFAAPFLAQEAKNARFFRPASRAGHSLFDLAAYVAAGLEGCGIGAVFPSPADTCAQEQDFFSYRRATLRQEGETGRHLSALILPD